jgi:hypothetical protein
MKKIALILILPLVLSLAAVAAQKKDASKKSTESATSEQHVVLNPADLKWGDAPPGFDEAAGKEMGAGGYMFMPPGMKHYAWTPAETIIQVQGMGPFVINYVNPTDEPRNAKK